MGIVARQQNIFESKSVNNCKVTIVFIPLVEEGSSRFVKKYMIMYKWWLHFGLFLTLTTGLINALQVCVQKLPKCEGTELDCSRSVPCYHGNCSVVGSCICQQCWSGQNCDQYVDYYQPKFLVTEITVKLSPYDSGILFTANGLDEDRMNTCRDITPCPCGEMRYSIVSGNEKNLFEVDPKEGDVYLRVGQALQPGSNYPLIIVVESATSDFQESLDSTLPNKLQLTLIVSDVDGENTNSEVMQDDTEENLQSEEENHIRRKRGTESTNDTLISMTYTDAATSVLNVGDRIDLNITIIVPDGVTMDLIVEIFTSDLIKSSAAYTICNLVVQPLQSGVTSTVNPIKPQLFPNTDLPFVTDHATISFGNVSGVSGKDISSRTILITFTAVLVSNSPYVIDGGNYSIMAGISYAQETFIWVAAATFTANLSPDDEYFPSYQTISGPDNIGLDGYGVYVIDFFSATPLGTLQIDVFGNREELDSYSAGAIVISSVGQNFMCMNSDLLSYKFDLKPSTSGLTSYRSTLLTNGLINCAVPGTNRNVTNTAGNEMLIKFLVYVPPTVKTANSILSIGATITINDKTIWTNVLNITIMDVDNTKQGPGSMTVRNTSVSTILKGVATIMVDIVIPELKYSSLVLQVLAPDTVGAIPVMSICDASPVWGMNIPLVASIQPNLTSRLGGPAPDKMIANFGRVWNSALIPGNTTAGTVTVSISVRIEDQTADGKSISIQLLNGVGGTSISTKSVTINVNNSPQSTTELGGTVNVTLNDVLNATNLAFESETSIEMTISFGNPSAFNSHIVEVMATLFNETMEGRVCRVALTSVGKKIPCMNTNMINSQVTYQSLNKNSTEMINTFGSMNLGSVCLTDDVSPGSGDGNIVVTAAFELLKQLPSVTDTSYTLYSGIKFGQAMIWAGSANYDVVSSVTEKFPAGCQPAVSSYVSTTAPAMAGMVALVMIRIKIPPTSQSTYKLTVTAVAGEPYAICQLSLYYVGYNFPCIDLNPKPGNISRSATTRLNYDQFDTKLLASRMAILDFGPLSNLGEDVLTSDPSPDANTIIVAASIKIDSTANRNLALKYTLTYISNSTTLSMDIPLSSNTPQNAATTTNATLVSLDGNNTIQENFAKVIALDFIMPSGPPADTVVTFSNPNSANNDFVFCSAAVTNVGRNIPCLNASSVTYMTNSTSGTNCSNTLQVNLGSTCLVNIINDPYQNWIRVEAAVSILKKGLTGSITIQASTSIRSLIVQAEPLVLTVNNLETPSHSSVGLTVINVVNGTIPAAIASRTWVDFNVTVPFNVAVPLKLSCASPSANGRAIMTMTDVRISAAGINVACIKNTTIVNVLLNTSVVVTTQQHDEAIVDFGYINNNGMTYRRGYNQSYDDQIMFSVQVLMGDHPIANKDTTHSLTCVLKTANESFNVSQTILVTRNMTEAPDIAVVTQVPNSKLFQKGEVANIKLLLSHTANSNAEPTQMFIRLYLPNYVTFSNESLSANATIILQSGTNTALLISDPFLFEQFTEVNFSVIIDPNGIRDPGSGMTNATSLGQVFATMTVRNFGDTPYPSTNNYMYAGKGFFWLFGVSGGNCHNQLGMQSGLINDCQLTASATVSPQYGPSKARMGNAAGQLWKPAVRSGNYQNFIQVDFGNHTRVSQISLQKDPCCRSPTAIILQYSDQGIYWHTGYSDPSLNYTGDTAVVDLTIPFEGRMLRIVINATDEPEKANTKYIGVKLEFYGCSLTTDVSINDICNITDRTTFSNDATSYRHFSVDTQHNAVYACDIQPNTHGLQCFCSKNGDVWKNIPSYIINIVGFNAANGFTYGRSTHNATFFKSEDCLTWLPANDTEVLLAQTVPQFKISTAVPGLVQNDPGIALTVGSWKADFDGLYLNNNKRLGWS